jgi:small conductance mechanosensitive channel
MADSSIREAAASTSSAISEATTNTTAAISEATANTTNAISQATQATTELVQNAGKATTRTVIEKASEYKDIYTTINELVHNFWERVPYLVIALIVFLFFWMLSRLFKLFVRKALDNRTKNKQNLVLVLNRIGSTFIIFVGFMIALVVAIPGFTPGQLISALGIGSVAIGFAFKDVFQNLLSGILLLLSEPFRIGDEIVSGSFEGTVEDIQIRATYIRTGDGRRIVIPNANLFTNAVTVNTAFIKRRCAFDVGIGYDDDIEEAKKIILATLDKIRTVESDPIPTVQVKLLGDFAVILTVKWWIDVKDVTLSYSIDEVQVLVKKVLSAKGISIPYPTQQLLVNNTDTALTPEDLPKKSDF